MNTAFATLTDLQDRLEWQMSEDEQRVGEGALEDASELARAYGRDWQPEAAPRLVRTLVLRAVVRYMRNPDGYTQSRAGDETVAWDKQPDEAGSVSFTDSEQRLIAELAGRKTSIVSVPVYSYSYRSGRCRTGFAPVEIEGKPFPMFADDAGSV